MLKKHEKNVRTGRPSVEGGNPEIAARNKPPLKYGGSRQKPKVRGEKPPVADEPGGGVSPAHKVALRRAAAERVRKLQQKGPGSRFD